jgi:hypothetical protein
LYSVCSIGRNQKKLIKLLRESPLPKQPFATFKMSVFIRQ